VTVVYPGSGAMLTVKSITLPHVTLTWTSENSLVAAGHDCQPILYKGSEQGWSADGSLDDTTAPKTGGSGFLPKTASGGVGRLNSAAFTTFRNADIRGQSGIARPGSPTTPGSGGGATEHEMMTVHQNTITSVRPYEGTPGNVSKVVTTGVDGKLVIWQVAAVGDITTKMAQTRLR
jgi:actin related protein 2/3 complex, subunit 1A/1B